MTKVRKCVPDALYINTKIVASSARKPIFSALYWVTGMVRILTLLTAI